MNETRKTELARDDAQAKVNDIAARISVLSSGREASQGEADRISRRLCGDVLAGELAELTIQKGQLEGQLKAMDESLGKMQGDLEAAQAKLARAEKEVARGEYSALLGEFHAELEANVVWS